MSLPLHDYEKNEGKSSIDSNKNINKPKSTTTNHIRSRKLLAIVTISEIASFFVIIKNRETFDNLHQLLNSILLGSMSAGLSQSIIQYYRPVNYSRIAKFFIWGGVNGILTSYWIDFVISCTEKVSYRVFIDIGVGSPFFQGLFLIYNCIWENNDIKFAFFNSFFRTMMASYSVWTFASIICFGYLPQHLIFPFNCSVTLLWNVILGLLT